MYFWSLFLVFLFISFQGFRAGCKRALKLEALQQQRLRSTPRYFGLYVLARAWLLCLFVSILWGLFSSPLIRYLTLSELALDEPSYVKLDLIYATILNLANGSLSFSATNQYLSTAVDRFQELSSLSSILFGGLLFSLLVLGIGFSLLNIKETLDARAFIEKLFKKFLLLSSLLAICITSGIVLSLLFESLRFFQMVPLSDFLLGLKWSPQTALRSDQVAAAGAFGILPLFLGTSLIAAIAIFVAGPIGLFIAVYLSEYASRKLRSIAKPLLEILAGIPTVVYGFFAILTLSPFLRDLGIGLGLEVSPESALAAGLIMGVMIIPFISSLSDDVINAVPQALRDASLALGATQSETIKKVVLPSALPGIVGSFLLAISRAIGETMIVVMAAGLAAKMTINPLENVTTVTVQIVNILVGDQEFDSAKTLSAFSLGLTLFCATLILNLIALRVVKRYRERYE